MISCKPRRCYNNLLGDKVRKQSFTHGRSPKCTQEAEMQCREGQSDDACMRPMQEVGRFHFSPGPRIWTFQEGKPGVRVSSPCELCPAVARFVHSALPTISHSVSERRAGEQLFCVSLTQRSAVRSKRSSRAFQLTATHRSPRQIATVNSRCSIWREKISSPLHAPRFCKECRSVWASLFSFFYPDSILTSGNVPLTSLGCGFVFLPDQYPRCRLVLQ
jgi:hypothetical protein